MSNSEIRDLFVEIDTTEESIILDCPDATTVDSLTRKIHHVRNKEFLQSTFYIIRNSKDLTIEVGLK